MYTVYAMKEKSYKSLKSGTDVRGIAVRTEDYDVTLTIDAIIDITKAFLKWLADKTGKTELRIAVGNDSRISSEAIYAAVQRSVTDSGCTVVRTGLSTTPSMFTLLKESDLNCDASIMITASHLSYEKNGLKFFTPEGGLSSDDVDEILFLAEKGECLPRKKGNVEYANFMDAYSAKLIDVVRKGTGKSAPLFGKRIIVDASNGAGGFFVKNVLQQLGAITDGSVNVEPDGDFPAHAPNPEDPKAINALREAVLENRAELGIIFDADVDRAAVVDGNGTLINRDNLIAVTAVTVMGDKPTTIVTDSVTIDGLSEFIRNIGGKHVRYKRGYKNVIDEAKRRNEIGEYCPLAIETSGHAAFLENYFLDDGAYLICKLLVAHANQTAKREKLSDLIATMDHPVEENEVRVKFNENSVDFKREGERVLQEIKFFANLDKKIDPLRRNYEGVRMNFPEGHGDGWTLIRMSVHDPVMPINFASRKAGGNKLMATQLYSILEKYPFLDTTSLKQFISDNK